MKIIPNPILYKVLNRGRLEGFTLASFLCILFFLLSGCSSYKKVYSVDEKLQPYITQFEKISNKKIDNLIVKFSYLSNKVVAQCTQGFNPLIEVNSRFINKIGNPAEMESIMFHELGHCILLRTHTETSDSIMYPYLIPAEFYLINYKLYISELFGIEYDKEFDWSVYQNE